MQKDKSKKQVLVVEDEKDVAQFMSRMLTAYHYHVTLAEGIQEALTILGREACDLVLLDINLRGESGLSLCQKMKSNTMLRHVPIILVTGMDTTEDMVNGLRLGADDFISKPFKKPELLARIESVLRRTEMSLEANPLSRLPGNVTIEKEILRRIEDQKPFSVIYADLNHFKAYNDYYGFPRGDKVIKKTSEILLKAAHKEGVLVGHVGGDDFVVVIGDDDPQALCKKIIDQFDAEVPSLYDEKERVAGFIVTKDRLGKVQRFPLLSLAIGVVANRVRPIHNLGEVATYGAELKKFAKKHTGSYVAIERRHDPYPAPQKKAGKWYASRSNSQKDFDPMNRTNILLRGG